MCMHSELNTIVMLKDYTWGNKLCLFRFGFSMHIVLCSIYSIYYSMSRALYVDTTRCCCLLSLFNSKKVNFYAIICVVINVPFRVC